MPWQTFTASITRKTIFLRCMRLFAFAVTMFTRFMAHADDQFADTCGRILEAFRAKNWAAFQLECAEEIVFERVQRIYTQNFSTGESKKIFGPPDWISNDVRNAPATRPEEANDRDVVVIHHVKTTRKLSGDERRAFQKFCDFVRDSYARESAAIEWGKNVRGGEVESLFGPAIEGKVASNFHWRVQLEEIDGRWRVRKLITEVH